MNLTSIKSRSRERKHALEGHGPIVDRARTALRHVAVQFGEVVHADETTVSTRTADGIELTLSYAPGNYVFSRVYNLTVSTVLPGTASFPSGAVISHSGSKGPRFTAGKAFRAGSITLAQLNAACAPHLNAIDVLQSTITASGDIRTLSVTPMGGSYVWVLIPPVFKATTFPSGEPARILQLIRSVRELAATNV